MGLAPWQDKGKLCSARWMIFRPDTPMMECHDLMTDGETESCSSCAGFGEAGLDKFIKDRFQFSFRNAGP